MASIELLIIQQLKRGAESRRPNDGGGALTAPPVRRALEKGYLGNPIRDQNSSIGQLESNERADRRSR